MKINKQLSLCLALLTFGVLVGGSALYKTVMGFKNMQNPKQPEPAHYCFETTFSLCGHTDKYDYTEEQAVPTLSELKTAFPDWDVHLNNNRVHLSRTIDKYCNLHYYAHLADQKIKISYRDGTPKDEIDTRNLNLSDAEKMWLEKGVYLDGKEALNAFLEDFDS